MPDVISVQRRETRGKRNARRQRAEGTIPAVLYGHGEATVSLAVPAEAMAAAMRHGNLMVLLAGAVDQSALIREIQWDTYGTHMLHIDFARVSADERVTVELAIELRGEAPGVKEGGIIEQPVHEVEIECRADAIPEKLVLRINQLKLGDSLEASVLELPEGAKLLIPADTLIVQCVSPLPEAEEGAEAPESAEPELVGRKAGEEEEGEKED